MYLIHITRDGDRWDQIAYRYYNDPYAYERIIAANPNVPIVDVLPAGIRLAVPIIHEELTEEDLPPWMR